MVEILIKPIEISELSQFEWTGSSTHLKYFEDALKQSEVGKVLFLGAWSNGEAIGRCGIDFEKNAGKATIWMFNVKDGQQGQGIGTQLMEKAETLIADKGIREVVLNVEEENIRAQELYIRRGYVSTGVGTESWEEDGPNGTTVTYNAKVVHMSKKLS